MSTNQNSTIDPAEFRQLQLDVKELKKRDTRTPEQIEEAAKTARKAAIKNIAAVTAGSVVSVAIVTGTLVTARTVIDNHAAKSEIKKQQKINDALNPQPSIED